MDSKGIIDTSKVILNRTAAELAGKGYGDFHWTKQIKKSFIKLGKSQGYYTCTHGLAPGESDWGEWLYDITWIKYGKSGKFFNPYDFHEVILTLESEWGDVGSVRDDYQKLVQAKSRFKVMIWQADNGFGNGNEVNYLYGKFGI